MSVNVQEGGSDKAARGPLRTLGFVGVTDAEAAWALLAPYAAKGWNVWVSVGGLNASVTSGRGKRTDVVGLPALFLDLDYRSGSHAVGDLNPSPEEAERWIAAAPPATVTTFTGGGRHLYWVLDELLDFNTEEGADLLARHKAFWMGLAAADGLSIDKSVLADPARILRVAGTTNPNQGDLPVTLESADGPTYGTAQLLAVYPPVEARQKETRTARVAHDDPRPGLALPQPKSLSEPRIGDMFAVKAPVSTFAAEVFGAEQRAQNGLTFPNSEGELPSYDSARLYPGGADQPERVTFFDSDVQHTFGLDDVAHSWSSFDLLAHSVDGGYPAAAKLLAEASRDGDWTYHVFDAITARLAPAIAAAFGVDRTAPEADVEDLTSGEEESDEDDVVDRARIASLLASSPDTLHGPVTLGRSELTVARAVTQQIPSSFALENNVTVYVWDDRQSPFRHGIYKTSKVKNDDGSWDTRVTQITSWVPWKSQKSEQMTTDASGRRIETAEPFVTVTIATADRRVKSRDGFTVAESHNPKVVVDRLDFGVGLPLSEVGKGQVANVLRQLGAHDGAMEVVQEYGTMGWLRTDSGEWVYLAAAGTVGATGPVDGYRVTKPPRSAEGDVLKESHLSYGWETIPQTREAIRQAAASIQAFMAITPNHLAAFGMLGLAFSAPLCLGERTSIFLIGLPDHGKSQLLKAFQAFLTGNSRLSTWTGGTFLNASPLGVGIIARWGKNACTVFDDYRIPENDPKKAAVMEAAVAMAIQQSYGSADSGVKSTVNGGLVATTQSDATSILSGEALPNGGVGVLSRTIAIEVAPGDIIITPRGQAPLDLFRRDHTQSAHALYGAYVQWLAARLNSVGSMSKFRSANEQLREEHAPPAGRSASNASVVGVGWAMLREWARKVGFEDLLPREADVSAAVAEMAGANQQLVKEANPAKRIIEGIRDAVASGRGHVALHNMAVPARDLAIQLGWKWNSKFADLGAYEAHNDQLGVLSADGQWVIIRKSAVADFKKRLDLGALPQGQLDGSFEGLVMHGTTPGGKAARWLSELRPRGYVVAAEYFDIHSDGAEDPDPSS